jgi:uncharacterized membrane protein
MSFLYVIAGINHFWHESMYLKIMPPYLPAHDLLVKLSGVCETALGLLLLPTATRRIAAWLIIALLVAIYPANIQMAIDYYNQHNPLLWAAILRLPLQIPLIVWAWKFARKSRMKTSIQESN